ncbi:transglutaminase family protein [Terriglobus sp. TAA 43]|uniref:transglutaminase-like domain-containing protein n=1 Tax=Terriglobus sp. TAA 43 TaxID=278961 RepID=UPI00068CD56E|nr:transglutaminase family protein [Terriglobus sp. TAA 43]
MKIKSEFDIQFHIPRQTPVVAVLHVHPSVESKLLSADTLRVEHIVAADERLEPIPLQVSPYIDSFGNRCSRFVAPEGAVRLSGSHLMELSDTPDPQGEGLGQTPIEDLPDEALQFLLASRYCQVDEFGAIAAELFGSTRPGWERAATIRDWVHSKVTFNYNAARSTKTAMDVFTERVGVCRDFQHLAITLTRALNIPARYVTGYLGDIRVPYAGPGDFSAWYQVWLDGQWWNMDARHHTPRLGRIPMAFGRDAADVAITTSFGLAELTHFHVESNEVDSDGRPVPLPTGADANATSPIAPQ